MYLVRIIIFEVYVQRKFAFALKKAVDKTGAVYVYQDLLLFWNFFLDKLVQTEIFFSSSFIILAYPDR